MNLKGFYFLDFLSFSFSFRKTEKGDPRGGVDGQKWRKKTFSPGWYLQPGLEYRLGQPGLKVPGTCRNPFSPGW